METSRGKSQATGELRRKRQRLWWIWQASFSWATAFSLFLGSCLFLMASTFRLLKDVSLDRDATRVLVLTPYFIGSLFFTTGCILPLPRVFSQYKESSKRQKRRRPKVHNEREVEKGRFQLYIAKLDVAGALLASCGGLLINSATFIDLYLGSKAELIFTTDASSLWIITLPTMLGRALFILAGWFTWAARNRSWRLKLVQGSPHFRWTTLLFWLGTLLFYAGWFCTGCAFDLCPEILVQNWCCVCGGYILGSVLLIAASYIMVLEIADSSGGQIRQSSEVETPLLPI